MDRKSGFMLVVLFVLMGALPAVAQVALCGHAGWNGGVHGHLESVRMVEGSDVGPFWGAAAFNGYFGQEGRRQRYGVSFGTQQVRTIPAEGENYATKYRQKIFQLETERLVVKTPALELIWGVAAGFVSRSHANENDAWNYCDTAFCGLPDFNWVLSPVVKANLEVSPHVLVSAQVRGNIYTGSAGDTFPYKAGPVFMAGVELRLPGWPGQEGAAVPREPAENPLH